MTNKVSTHDSPRSRLTLNILRDRESWNRIDSTKKLASSKVNSVSAFINIQKFFKGDE